MDPGAGIDTADYSGAAAGIVADLGTGASNDGDGGVDTYDSAFENLLGSGFNDTITGDGNANYLYGGQNNDSLVGGDGDDTIYGGPDSDFNAGFDTLDGGAGNDYLYGGSRMDTLYGGDGDDTLIGGGDRRRPGTGRLPGRRPRQRFPKWRRR